MNPQKFINLISAATNQNALVASGTFKKETLDAYIRGHRKARPVSIMLACSVLGVSWASYV